MADNDVGDRHAVRHAHHEPVVKSSLLHVVMETTVSFMMLRISRAPRAPTVWYAPNARSSQPSIRLTSGEMNDHDSSDIGFPSDNSYTQTTCFSEKSAPPLNGRLRISSEKTEKNILLAETASQSESQVVTRTESLFEKSFRADAKKCSQERLAVLVMSW